MPGRPKHHDHDLSPAEAWRCRLLGAASALAALGALHLAATLTAALATP